MPRRPRESGPSSAKRSPEALPTGRAPWATGRRCRSRPMPGERPSEPPLTNPTRLEPRAPTGRRRIGDDAAVTRGQLRDVGTNQKNSSSALCVMWRKPKRTHQFARQPSNGFLQATRGRGKLAQTPKRRRTQPSFPRPRVASSPQGITEPNECAPPPTNPQVLPHLIEIVSSTHRIRLTASSATRRSNRVPKQIGRNEASSVTPIAVLPLAGQKLHCRA